MQRSKWRKLRRPEGRCYEVAARLVLEQREGILVHGQVWSVPLRRMIDHAWVEVPAGGVLEDDTGDREVLTEPAVVDLTLKERHRVVPKWWYVAVAKAEEFRRYSVQDVLAFTLRHGTWGPWEDPPT